MRLKLLTIPIEDRKVSVERLMGESSPKAEFFLLLVLAIIIVTLGLLMGNLSIIIIGMLVAPLLSPILSVAMGIVVADVKVIGWAARTLMLATILIVGISLIVAFFFPDRFMTDELAARSSASLAGMIVAVASGVAAAFAFSKSDLSATIPGIAVAVSLLPPIAATGVGLSMGDWTFVVGSFSVFLVNLVGVVLAATVVFSLLGFHPLRRKVEETIEKEEKDLNATA
ncbi:TIGR00341 family protein [Patescibacteria group bacterium]|nr:TIGR00341 family protein [Patescibacteria group bacterium]